MKFKSRVLRTAARRVMAKWTSREMKGPFECWAINAHSQAGLRRTVMARLGITMQVSSSSFLLSSLELSDTKVYEP